MYWVYTIDLQQNHSKKMKKIVTSVVAIAFVGTVALAQDAKKAETKKETKKTETKKVEGKSEKKETKKTETKTETKKK